MTVKLSAILITKNEAHNLQDCLQTLTFADEIIIVDNNSQDNTVAIAKSFSANIIVTHDWPGFGAQKNRALQAATGEWILSIDADERLTPALQHQIQLAIHQTIVHGYFIKRISSFCDQWIYHGDWADDWVLRLFQKKHGHFSDDIVHEKVMLSGNTDKLKNHMLHYSYRNLEDALEKTNRYSSLSAAKRFSEGKTTSLIGAIFRANWTFYRGYLLRLGFLDGYAGLLLAIHNAHACFYRHAKLWLRHRSREG